MTRTKSPPLLVADDISLETNREKRSNAVKLCAGRIALRLGNPIHLVHVEDLTLYPVPSRQFKPLIESYFRDQKSKLTTLAESFEVPTQAVFLNGEPAKKILSLGNKQGAYEMIVVGTHGRTGLRRLILGSVAEEIIRESRVPVMTVGPKAQEKAASFLTGSKMSILIPTSLTPNSLRAEAYGVSLARKLGAEVVFFHNLLDALHPVLQTAFTSPSQMPQARRFFREIEDSAVRQLKAKMRNAVRKNVTASYVLDDDTLSSDEAILNELKRAKASLVVMGTQGRSMVSGTLFGRTARDVILGSTVPVLTVRSKKT